MGESPNEVYKPIKQAFNLLVDAQELAEFLAAGLSALYNPKGCMGLLSLKEKIYE